MPKRTSKGDINETAFSVVQQVTGKVQPDSKTVKNPAAVALGRLGGLKGGMARKLSLTSERRIEIAKAAAEKRWSNQSNAKENTNSKPAKGSGQTGNYGG